MTVTSIAVGQSRVVGFFVIICLFGGIGVVRGLLAPTQDGPFFPMAQSIFVLFTAAASWYLYQSKSAGWYLSLVVVLNWFLALSKIKVFWNLFAILMTVGMVAVLVWLSQPKVREHFGVSF